MSEHLLENPMRIYCLLSLMSLGLFGATFQSSSENFKFNYNDSNWEVVALRFEKNGAEDIDKSMAQQTVATIHRIQADDKYHARFHVVTDSIAKFTDTKTPVVSQYQKYTVEFLKSQRFQIFSVEPIQLPNVKETAFEIIANQRDFGLKFKQVIFVHSGKAYILTATTRTEKYDAYKNELKVIFDSFEFLPTAK